MTLGESIIATCNAARSALLAAYRSMPYSDYLLTDHWLAVRTGAVYRAGGRCQLCGNQQRIQVHHNTYENLGQEKPEDLIVLCQPCHEKHHKKGPIGTGPQANGGSAPNGGGGSSIAETNDVYGSTEAGAEASENGAALSIEYRPRRRP